MRSLPNVMEHNKAEKKRRDTKNIFRYSFLFPLLIFLDEFKVGLIESSKEFIGKQNDRNGTTFVARTEVVKFSLRAKYKMHLQAVELAANDNITGNDDAICADKE